VAHLYQLFQMTAGQVISKPTKFFQTKEEFMRFVAKAQAIPLKEDYLCALSAGKDVLDLGCVNHSYERAMSLGDQWPHKRLKSVAKSIVGIDILREDVAKLNAAGYNITVANAESFDLGRTFDVINCGDIVEHLSNIGLFFQSVEKHMGDDSICVITTPNPFNIEQIMLAIFHGSVAVNDEHTVWIDPRVMFTAVSRTGLRIVDFSWIETRFKFVTARKYVAFFVNAFSRLIMRLRPICRRDYCVVLKKHPGASDPEP
jgi:2-polyprenyl-3-methyl-5-hydroxy-6-metoxy-1,4-benzoquinol methylase